MWKRDTVSNFSCEESEWGSVSSVEFAQPMHPVLSTPLPPPRNINIHKPAHIPPMSTDTSISLPDVRATHHLNFLLQIPTPPPIKHVRGYRLHKHIPIVSNIPYTLTPHTQPIASTRATSHTCPIAMFVHKHIRLVRTAFAQHVTLLHNAHLVQTHAYLSIAITHRKIHTQRPVCFASNPSYASSSSLLSWFRASVFTLFFSFLMLLSYSCAPFPRAALVVGIGWIRFPPSLGLLRCGTACKL